MPNDNTKQLQKLASFFNTDKLLTSDDVTAILQALIKVLATNKASVTSLNADTKATIQKSLKFVVDEVAKLRQDTSATHKNLADETNTKVAAALQQAQALIAEAKAAMPKDGKNPDPADVVPLVMQQIKLPENKQYILSGADVLDSLNNLPADDEDYKIDASRIKNLPRLKGSILHGGFRNPRIYSGSTLIAKSMPALEFTGVGVTATVAADGTVIVTIPGGTGNPADETMTDSGDHTTFTLSHAPIANTLLIINQNTGQAVATSAYTNTTTSVVFGSSQAVDDGTGNLVTPTFRARYFY
jgi:hypothetical protein